MKALLLVASLLVSAVSFAGEYTSYQSILFQSASTYVRANNVCLSGGNIFHKTKSAVEVKHCDDNNANCSVESRPLRQPIVSTAQRCADFSGSDDSCVRWVSYTLKQGPTAKIFVYGSAKDYEDDRTPVAVRTFNIPSCR